MVEKCGEVSYCNKNATWKYASPTKGLFIFCDDCMKTRATKYDMNMKGKLKRID